MQEGEVQTPGDATGCGQTCTQWFSRSFRVFWRWISWNVSSEWEKCSARNVQQIPVAATSSKVETPRSDSPWRNGQHKECQVLPRQTDLLQGVLWTELWPHCHTPLPLFGIRVPTIGGLVWFSYVSPNFSNGLALLTWVPNAEAHPCKWAAKCLEFLLPLQPNL